MILIIDNYDSFTYNLYQAIIQCGMEVTVIRNDLLSVKDILALNASGIVLSPGPGRPEDAGICMELIQSMPPNLPLLGVCLGMQALVAAMGGRIVHAPEIMHGKSDAIFHEKRGLYRDMPSPFNAGRYHSLMAERDSLPSCLAIESQNKEGLIMGVRHHSNPFYGVQFHPESIMTPLGCYLLTNFVKTCGAFKTLKQPFALLSKKDYTFNCSHSK